MHKCPSCENQVEYGKYCSVPCRNQDLSDPRNQVIYKDAYVELLHWFFEGIHTVLIKFFDTTGKEKYRTTMPIDRVHALHSAMNRSLHNNAIGEVVVSSGAVENE